MPPGRNDPCPCGSGRKFKKCHGDPVALAGAAAAEAAARAAARMPSEIVADKRNLVHTEILRFIRKRGGEAWMRMALDAYIDEWSDAPDEGEVQAAVAWAMFHFNEDGTGLSMAEQMRLEGRHRLTPELSDLLDAEIASFFSVWEVTAVIPGIGLDMHDRLTGQRRFVRDISASHDAPRHASALARIVDYDGISTVGAMFPYILGPFETAAVVAETRRAFRVRTRPIKAEKLRDPYRQLDLLDLWRSMLDDIAIPPTLANTDGDPLSFVSDRFDFDPSKRAAIAAALLTIPGAESHEAPGETREVIITRPSAKSASPLENTIIARVVIQGGRLRVETNSIRRADAVRELIESQAGALVRYRIRDETSAAAAMDPAITPPSLAPPEEPTEEMQEIVRQFREQHMVQWLDDNIPALGGLTPREAAADPKHHAELELLLRHLEFSEHHLPAAERTDVGRLRTTLGM